MPNIKHRVGIVAPADKVWDALTTSEGLAGWWASSATVTEAEFQLEFTGLTTLTFAVEEQIAGARLQLKSSTDPHPWGGSVLEFQLRAADDQVFVTLLHQNPRATDEEFQFFMTKWPLFLVSLKQYAETGAGMPFPNDVKIQADL